MQTVELKYKTRFRRILAVLIDFTILLPLVFLDEYIYEYNKLVVYLLHITLYLPFIFYGLLLNYYFGQTIGKMACGIKIVSFIDETKISFKQALLRSALDLFIDFVCTILLAYIFLNNSEEPKVLIENFYDLMDYLFLILYLVEFVFIFTNSKSRSICDYFANTVVIRTNSQ